MERNRGWDHDIRLATEEERKLWKADEPSFGPHCRYCKLGVAYVASWTRWHGTRSAVTGTEKREPWRREINLCEFHGREWIALYQLPIVGQKPPLPIPTPLCPSCGLSVGLDHTMKLMTELGLGIHEIEFQCTECRRDFTATLAFGRQIESHAGPATLPPASLAP